MMLFRDSLACLLLLGVSFSGAVAQTSMRHRLPDVTGTIIDVLGNPIAGAEVVVEEVDQWQDIEWRGTTPEQDPVLATGITNRHGMFQLTWKAQYVSGIGNPCGIASLIVRAPEHALTFRAFSLQNANDFSAITLATGADLVGQVLDDNGNPIADAQVRIDGLYASIEKIYYLSTMEGVLSLLQSTSRPKTKTDQDGRFQFSDLPSGQLALLHVTHPKFPPMRRLCPIDKFSPRDLKLKNGGNIGTFSDWYSEFGEPIRMRPGKLVTVKAIEQGSGEPLSGLEICSFMSGQSVFTDEAGTANLVQPTNIERVGRYGTPVFIRRPSQTLWYRTTISSEQTLVELPIPKPHIVSGVVRDEVSGQGIDGIAVTMGQPGQSDFQQTWTDANGRYSLLAYVPSVKVELRGPRAPYVLPVHRCTTSLDEPGTEVSPSIHQRFVKLFSGDVKDADFSVARFAPIEVELRDQSDKPLPGSSAILQYGPFPSQSVNAISDSKGIVRFEIDREIPERSAVVAATKDGFGMVQLQRSASNRVQLKLRPSIKVVGQLTFKHSDGTEEPALQKSMWVRFKETATEYFGMDYPNGIQLQLATTDDTGKFSVFLPRISGDSAKLFADDFLDSPKHTVTVSLGASRHVDMLVDVP